MYDFRIEKWKKDFKINKKKKQNWKKKKGGVFKKLSYEKEKKSKKN